MESKEFTGKYKFTGKVEVILFGAIGIKFMQIVIKAEYDIKVYGTSMN